MSISTNNKQKSPPSSPISTDYVHLSTNDYSKLEVELLSGQESFRIKSFVKSNVWAVLPNGKISFKKGQIIDCFLTNQFNKTLA